MILFTNTIENTDNNTKFDTVYDTYYAYAYKIAFNILKSTNNIEDVMQEVFINVWKSLDVITDEQSAKAWISTVSRNTAINAMNKNKTQSSRFIEIDDDTLFSITLGGNDNPADILVSEDNIQAIYDAIKELKPIYSDILILKYKFGHSPEQISKLLKVNVKTVYTRLNRGNKILREKLRSLEGRSVI